MSQQYVGDLSALQWTFDYNLRLWRCYDAASGQFMNCDEHGYVRPLDSTFQHAPGNSPVFYSPWSQYYHQPGPVHTDNVQNRSGTNEIYAVRPTTHGWHTVTRDEDSNLPVPNVSYEDMLDSRPISKANSEHILTPGLAKMSLNDNTKHSLLTSAAPISQPQHALHLPCSEFSNESVSSGLRRSVQPSEDELLRKDFRRHKKPRKFFVFGKVFLVLWSEPGRDATETEATAKAWTKNNYDEWVYSKVRRFVVVKEQDRSCMAIPVVTYQGQGVAKRGVKKADHAIIFTGKQVPSPSTAEEPEFGEAGMRSRCIRVDTDQPDEKLDFMSRIDFSAVQKVQHYCKVKSFGKVNRDSLAALEYQYRAVLSEPRTLTVPSNSMKSQRDSSDGNGSDPLLSRPGFQAFYDALIGVNYTSEQAMQFLGRRARDYPDSADEMVGRDKDNESETAEQRSEYTSDA